MTDDVQTGSGADRGRPWVPASLADRYALGRELGAGAAAVTFAAVDRRLGREVAIKLLRPETERDSGFTTRFNREARAAAAINHPNVVSVYDVGQEGDLHYLVMQLVDGIDLKRMLEREGAIPWQRATEIAMAVLAGLAPIHDAGIVHRDIKPQNVLIGRHGEVKVTDFGVAHLDQDAALTVAGTTVGTAAYMAPEQAKGLAPTPSADIYAVGVMLYEMVTGAVPFDGPNALATMLAHIQQAAPAPIAPTGREPVPARIAQVILQAMAKEPASRFQTAAAMRRALASPGSRSGTTTASTVAVPAMRKGGGQAPWSRGRDRSEPPNGSIPATGGQGGGLGSTIVTLLVVLALMAAVAAGSLWLLEERPNLFGGGGGEPPATELTGITPTPTETINAPGVIVPDEDEPTPTPTSTPPPTREPTVTPPLPTEAIIEPVETMPPSTEPVQEQIIEPIEGSTVVPESQD